MPDITFIQHDGSRQTVFAKAGVTIMQAAMENMVEGLEAECGGSGSCATCHCYLSLGWHQKVQAPDSNEEQMLEMVIEPKEGSRLSCQVKVTDAHDGLIVHLPECQY
ncbi:2Fe-2S iron-sulfur cluster-binding protein [Marinomonas mediterranea]|jgi:Ferredoxin|uniref:Ferredoxin n=1 Tax=Marinomonas mediterranea (strain ATCC 700492 / JCM 21426 / NBRC 103028 / MMB-1) TaxID=717774 RepID=F2K072_MARM1|nr:2Fe-2S iron-sulfur cluster-binding protein [Marinomonas mediterranea]ADZ93286.1 ferredoxin [Marinomonas mediterranea MMB-1]WCN11176.1 2Fe-2S iron-sulfur cluster binding domain-containing protein [Marinomonas mediterranea]WCN15238.1 2Fe-2S iron-sulfur cluster binding domain-containing protein [Marinomonas mediterranea]WCN19284.1 2Fe-2S iron-sulfur cluster binding domain-containing protein [Marinomonas mediterranea MMB-1]